MNFSQYKSTVLGMLIIVIVTLMIGSCEKPSSNTNNSNQTNGNAVLPTIAEREQNKEIDDKSNEPSPRDEARAAALEFVQKNYAGWAVKGTNTRQNHEKFYIVTLDLEKGKESKTVEVIARRFFPEKGEPYWKVEPRIVSKNQNFQDVVAQLAYCRDNWENMQIEDVPEELKQLIVEEASEFSDDSNDAADYDALD